MLSQLPEGVHAPNAEAMRHAAEQAVLPAFNHGASEWGALLRLARRVQARRRLWSAAAAVLGALGLLA